MAKGIGEKSTIDDYVVTPQLAGDFDRALGLVRSAIETGVSRAAYLDGSFGSGKSHFMAVLHAILRGDPAARAKKGLADVVAKHDPWLKGKSRFLLVPYHLVGSQTLDAAILGGYVAHVARDEAPGTPVPAVFRMTRSSSTPVTCAGGSATRSSSRSSRPWTPTGRSSGPGAAEVLRGPAAQAGGGHPGRPAG